MKKAESFKFDEKQLLSIYGLMFCVAYEDGDLDKDELRKIYEMVNLEGFSEEGKMMVRSFLTNKPDADVFIKELRDEIVEVRYCAYLNAIEVAICNDEYTPSEQKLLGKVKKEFLISDAQDKEMWAFARKMKQIASRGIDDKYAEDTLKSGVAGLAAVGVPIAAVYFSGSVIGLSAAGITSGLAALGLGLGMVPGIGVAILIGAAIVLIASNAMDIGGKRKKKKEQAEKEKRCEQVIMNLQDSINHLVDQMLELERMAKQAESNNAAIQRIQDVLLHLRQVMNAKKDGNPTC